MYISHSFCIYIFETKVSILNEENKICQKSQAFTKSSTLASSGVRENAYPNNKLELCWKMLFLMKLFICLLNLFINLIDITML